ncbi:MAG: AMMECR1 domain-containing protein [Monoraphidium minutum]|nr:MAG: AMMECR1 domain-containing protein [Monoraphidium minutum]
MSPGSAGVAAAEHCAHCFDSLVAHLNGQQLPAPEFEDGTCALFVTWNKAPSSTPAAPPRLRGCIGTLEPRRLHVALRDYALTSALRDSRFAPITARELPRLHCGVSLLRQFEAAARWDDWAVGTHGLIIEFTDPRLKCRRSATFLPEVAGEQGWSQRETIDSLIRKAGYDGPVDEPLLAALKVTRYQSSKARLTYTDYQSYRAARDGCRGTARVAGDRVPEAAPGGAAAATAFA